MSSKMGNLPDRMKHLLSSGEDADVHFLVGDGDGKELLLAHKLILKSASDMFEAMFRIETKNGEVKNVPDVEAEAFKVMLSFIYADDLSELNGDNAMAVLYAAKKFGVHGLIGQCLQKIPIPNLSNVLLAYAQARLLDLEAVAHQCLRYICQNAETLFGSEEFLQIDQNLLCEILDRDQLVIDNEFAIWKAALRWADEKCRQNAIECSAENRRSVLGPALFKIRFPLISKEEFSKNIVVSGILTTDEFVAVYQFHCHPNIRCVPGFSLLKFPTQTRISDWNKPKGSGGTIALEIEKFSQFSREENNSKRTSEAMHIKGLNWQIVAQIMPQEMTKDNSTEKCMGFFLDCAAPAKDGKWRCVCSATFRIVSQKRINGPEQRIYDKNEDKVTLAIDFSVEDENSLKFDSDPNKSNATILMEIKKFSDFSREIFGSERSSETVHIRGIPMKIETEIKTMRDSDEKHLGIMLKQTAQGEDGKWDFVWSATLRIVSQKNDGTEDLTITRNSRVFNSRSFSHWPFLNSITFAELMDPSKGFYDKNEDKVTLAIDIKVEEAKPMKPRQYSE
ncbi:hypothetical protein niasHT_032716 [Heterodera trifolii]|uniref:BTB domain-containing protein n=1 Tax=Heterodera trifolii TaxID=157864 RepID=A0ABD2IL82_9BILA